MQSLQASSCGQLRCCSQPSCSPVLQRGRGIRPNVMAFYIPEVQSGPSHPSPSSSLACSTPIPQLHNSSRPEQSCPPLPLPATSPRHVPATLLSCGLLVAGAMLLMPEAASASGGEQLTGQAAQLFAAFLEQVDSMGPAGSVLFVVVVTLFEMVPLFPTQPLSLASGLLFGPQKGALLLLLAGTLAATSAFLIARGVGRPIAQRIIDAEMGHAGQGGEASGIAKAMATVQATVESGGIWKQMTAIIILRLTPVVPFSASNYLLGLTPLGLPAFLGGTLIGMSVWSMVYASLGGASRSLLDGGAEIGALLNDLGAKAAGLSGYAATGSLIVVGAGLAVWGVKTLMSRHDQHVAQQHQQPSAANGSAGGEKEEPAPVHQHKPSI